MILREKTWNMTISPDGFTETDVVRTHAAELGEEFYSKMSPHIRIPLEIIFTCTSLLGGLVWITGPGLIATWWLVSFLLTGSTNMSNPDGTPDVESMLWASGLYFLTPAFIVGPLHLIDAVVTRRVTYTTTGNRKHVKREICLLNFALLRLRDTKPVISDSAIKKSLDLMAKLRASSNES